MTTAQTQTQQQATTIRMWINVAPEQPGDIPAREITPGTLYGADDVNAQTISAAIAAADYITIPVHSVNRRTGEETGMPPEKAQKVVNALAEKFGYEFTGKGVPSLESLPTSRSGNSHKCYRKALVSGVDVTDVLGL